MSDNASKVLNAIINLETSYAQLVAIVPENIHKGYHSRLLSDYHVYNLALANSVRALISDENKSHGLALASLLRSMAESMAIIYEATRLKGDSLERFMKAYDRGKGFPQAESAGVSKSQSYRQMVSRLPTSSSDGKELMNLYDECSKTVHISGKTRDLLNENDYELIIKWVIWFLKFAEANNKKSTGSMLNLNSN